MNAGIPAHALESKNARTWLVRMSVENQFQVYYPDNDDWLPSNHRFCCKQDIFYQLLSSILLV